MTLLAAKLVDELEAVGLGHVLGDVVKLLVTLVALLLRDNPGAQNLDKTNINVACLSTSILLRKIF